MQTSPFRYFYSFELDMTPQNMRPYGNEGTYFNISIFTVVRRTIPTSTDYRLVFDGLSFPLGKPKNPCKYLIFGVRYTCDAS